MDIVVRNGNLVTPESTIKTDIGIENGRIQLIGDLRQIQADRTIDAEGLYVLPGIIDVHNHIDHVGGAEKTRDDFFTGTRGAAFGGITTLMDFAMQKNDETVMNAIKRRREQADGKVCIDYSLHANITNLDAQSEAALSDIIRQGYTSFKLFMTYQKAGFMVDDPVLYRVMKKVYESGGIVGIHAENDAICEYLTEQFVREGKISPEYHAKSRPNIAEAECISRAILFAQHTDSALYIFHLTTKEGVELVRNARKQGLRVFAETCPHYLTLTEELYSGDDANRYIMTPPLRTHEDVEALWQGIGDGTISLVSSDHCCYATEQKTIGPGQSFRDITPGIPGNEALLPIVHHFGVNSGRITINKMVELLSANPARFFGMYPQKGSFDPGTDADIVLFDPNKELELRDADVHMATDYTPYRGITVKGFPTVCISKGKVIVEEGRFTGNAGDGRFIERISPDMSL